MSYGEKKVRILDALQRASHSGKRWRIVELANTLAMNPTYVSRVAKCSGLTSAIWHRRGPENMACLGVVESCKNSAYIRAGANFCRAAEFNPGDPCIIRAEPGKIVFLKQEAV